MEPNFLVNSTLFLADTTETKDSVQINSRTPHHHSQSSSVKQVPKVDQPKRKIEIVWKNVLAFIYLHAAALYGMYMFFFVASWKTFFWTAAIAYLCGLSITAGAHRLWAHRSYKAKLPLRIFLMIFQTISFQNSIFEWVRDHRVHHKFTDTDADPHNAQRGFFFSHIGWLMVKKHKDVMIKGKTIDLGDLEADPLVRFQRRFYLPLVLMFCFIIPAVVPWYYWGESVSVCWHTAAMFRYAYSLNVTWLVNSAAHIWGTKPYDNTIGPTENVQVALAAYGEGWHNYHHVFPWDYKAAELGNYRLNPTTMLIDFFAGLGWAYDLKTVSVDMVKSRVKRTGDGTRAFADGPPQNGDLHDHHHEGIWGWGDSDMKAEDIQHVKMYNKIEGM